MKETERKKDKQTEREAERERENKKDRMILLVFKYVFISAEGRESNQTVTAK